MAKYEDQVVKVFVMADWLFKDFYNTTKKKRKKIAIILWKRLPFFHSKFFVFVGLR